MRTKKEEAFRLVMTEADKAALAALAERDDGSQAAIVRRLIRFEAEKRGLWPIVQEQPIQQQREAAA